MDEIIPVIIIGPINNNDEFLHIPLDEIHKWITSMRLTLQYCPVAGSQHSIGLQLSSLNQMTTYIA